MLVRIVGEDKVWPRSMEAQGAAGSIGDFFSIDKFPFKGPAERTRGRYIRKAHESNEKPPGEWNQYEITLDRGDLELKVNELVQNRVTECLEISGKIGLQSEGVPMEYRNIVLIPIVKSE